MPKLIDAPAVVQAAGTKPKRIEEYAGRVNSGHAGVSVARMVSPEGWQEPGQRPEFEEITVVLRGTLRVEHETGVLEVRAGQAVVTAPGRVDPLQHSGSRGRRVCRRLPSGVFDGHRPPRRGHSTVTVPGRLRVHPGGSCRTLAGVTASGQQSWRDPDRQDEGYDGRLRFVRLRWDGGLGSAAAA